MKIISKSNFTLMINIIICVFFFLLIYDSQEFACPVGHDFVMPFTDDLNRIFFIEGRIPARLLSILMLNLLPAIFNINIIDFLSNQGAFILSIPILITCLIFTKSFFASQNEEIKIFKKMEFLLIFPLVFLIYAIPSSLNMYFPLFGIKEYMIYFEYIFPFLFLLIFYKQLLNIIQNKKNNLPLLFINTLLLCFWSETHASIVTFSILFTLAVICIQKKETIKNKDYKYLLISCIIGCTLLLFFSDYFSGTSITGRTFVNDNYLEKILNSKNFFYSYFNELIKINFHYILFIIVSTLFLIRKNNKNINATLTIVYITLFSYLCTNVLYIFFKDIGFFFVRWQNKILTENIFEFAIILILGCIYTAIKEQKKWEKIFIIITCILTIFIAKNFCTEYQTTKTLNYDRKFTLYDYTRRNIIFNTLGETAYIPKTYILSKDMKDADNLVFQINYICCEKEFKKQVEKYEILDSNLFLFDSIYEIEYDDEIEPFVYIVEDEIADIELDKRLTIWDEDINEFPKKLNFESLNKYSKIPKNAEFKDKLLAKKFEAYKAFKNKNFVLSKKLYLEYLDINPEDNLDAKMFLYNIYKKEKNTLAAEKILIDLDNEYKSNIFIKETLLHYYLNQKKKKQALKEVNEILKILKPYQVLSFHNRYEKLRNELTKK